jgi:hypothetical protein
MKSSPIHPDHPPLTVFEETEEEAAKLLPAVWDDHLAAASDAGSLPQ